MYVYILVIKYGIHKEVVGAYSSVGKANIYLESRFGNHRTYFETVKTNGVKLGYVVEVKLNNAYYYIDLIKTEMDVPLTKDKLK